MKTIQFYNNGISPGIKFASDSKYLLASVFENEKIAFKKISYIFCSDDHLLTLNQKYLHHNTLTDVLTFTLSDASDILVAEIYISVERVSENAKSLKTAYDQELFRVMIHAILHLCGYQDKTQKQKTLMRTKENYYLSRMFHVKRFT